MRLPRRDWDRTLVYLLCGLGISFASYDLIVWFAGDATSLLNVRVNDGWRIDESYMYLAGLDKGVLFEPYLKEHAGNVTLRPALPGLVFSAIYWLCARNLDLAIFIAHTIPPLFSSALLYLITLKLTGRRSFAVAATLLGVGHFIYTLIALAAAAMGMPPMYVSGPGLYLYQEFFGVIQRVGDITAPTQFTRLSSPSLTLPFLLMPLYLRITGRLDGLRGALIAANLYAYPHHIVFLGLLEVIYWLRDRKLPDWKFFASGIVLSIPYIMLNYLALEAGYYQDVYARIGRTTHVSAMWFFFFFFGFVFFYIWLKEKGTKKSDGYYLSLVCFILTTILWPADSFGTLPQVHLISLRVFAFLAPITLMVALGKAFHSWPRYLNLILFSLLTAGMIHGAWVNRNMYASFPSGGITDEYSALPSGSVVMTDVQYETPYLSAVGDKYPYLAYGIVSTATTTELLERFAIVAKLYDWSEDRIFGWDWDGMLPVFHWIYHAGKPSEEVRRADFNKALDMLALKSRCELLSLYKVDYIRFRNVPPTGLDLCTVPFSEHLLKVVHPPPAG